MKYSIVSGSHRADSQSIKIAMEIQSRLQKQSALDDKETVEVDIINLAGALLPLWDMDISIENQNLIDSIAEGLLASDGFIIVTPEWHGMVPAALKNFFLHFSGGQLAHKPALIVSVSAGDGGAYTVAELRSSSYKNSRICYLPEHLIIRDVGSVFNANGENHRDSQAYLDERLEYCLGLLNCYSESFRNIRESMPDRGQFINGM